MAVHCIDYSPISASCCYSNPPLSACVLLPTPSLRATVHVRVNDVNEFSPVFVERRYEASVPEGRLFDRIVRVEALDADCSPQYSQICFYDIITPNVPFAIDNDGEISCSRKSKTVGLIKSLNILTFVIGCT